MIKKYQEIYSVDIEDAEFFCDLEKTQTEGLKNAELKIGYFTKFKANTMEVFQTDSYYSYVIEDSHIIALDLSRWEIKELPESIGKLKKLQYLSLAGLELKFLPESIKFLSHLKYFNISGNNFTTIPNWLNNFIESVFSQKYIDEGVDSTEAKVLSIIEILNGEKLEKVSIDSDVLHWQSALNYKINNTGKIIGIYIIDEEVRIGIFPEIICNLKYIQELVLPQSSIKFIPNCIGELHNLRYLDLSFNRIKHIPESIKDLRNLENLELNDNDISEKELNSLIWNKNGQDFLETGDLNETIHECKSTLRLYPKNKIAWSNLGIAYKEIGNFFKAEKAFRKYIEIDSLNPIVWSNLSDVFHQKGEYADAIDAIKQAISIEPNISLLWSNLGFNYKKLGKYDKAIDAYLHSLDMDLKNKYVWKELALIYRYKGDYMKAIEADEKVIEIELELDDK